MAKQHRNKGRRIAPGLTTIFMSVALAGQAFAAADSCPPAPPSVQPGAKHAFCAQSMTKENLEKLTGYTDLDDFLMASAYAQFMAERERDPRIVHAILEASEETGVDFEVMLVKAMLESNLGKFNRPLSNKGSARGLYQYLPATWLTLFAWFGDRYQDGKYAKLAAAIEFDGDGEPTVKDEKIKKEILDLRFDPYMSAFLKAYQIKYDDGPALRSIAGHEPDIVDFYMVHFLGIPRARLFYRYLHHHPDRAAAPIMRKEARYNHSVFYRGHKARSFREVYERLDRIIHNRLKTANEVSKDVLAKNDCVTPLQKNHPPVAPQPLIRIAIRFTPPKPVA